MFSNEIGSLFTVIIGAFIVAFVINAWLDTR